MTMLLPETADQLGLLMHQLTSPAATLMAQLETLIALRSAEARAVTEARQRIGSKLTGYLDAVREPSNRGWCLLRRCEKDPALTPFEQSSITTVVADLGVHLDFLRRWSERLCAGLPPIDHDEQFESYGKMRKQGSTSLRPSRRK
jgi:hypothetical protein